jgi:hypothetical protein
MRRVRPSAAYSVDNGENLHREWTAGFPSAYWSSRAKYRTATASASVGLLAGRELAMERLASLLVMSFLYPVHWANHHFLSDGRGSAHEFRRPPALCSYFVTHMRFHHGPRILGRDVGHLDDCDCCSRCEHNLFGGIEGVSKSVQERASFHWQSAQKL